MLRIRTVRDGHVAGIYLAGIDVEPLCEIREQFLRRFNEILESNDPNIFRTVLLDSSLRGSESTLHQRCNRDGMKDFLDTRALLTLTSRTLVVCDDLVFVPVLE